MRNGNHYRETVLSVRHWTDRVFSFSTTRPDSLRFENGQFIMLGLPGAEERPLMRAYSFASANYEDALEFLSIKMPQGKLTSRLQRIRPGDELLLSDKPVGSLILPNLLPGKRIYLLGTGTGLAPFLSIAKDPELYERFEQVILVHGVRHRADLVYGDLFTRELPEHELLGEAVRRQLIYYPTVTREPFPQQGRITTLIESGQLFRDLGVPPMDPAVDRVMLCGSMAMLNDMRRVLGGLGLHEGCTREAGHFLVERAYVE
jgi:ferredoxin--NADP+ reductase